MHDLIFTTEADTDVVSAFDWYEAQQEGRGRQFVLAVDEACDRIREAPLRHAVLVNGIRRMPTRRFPYGVFYVMRRETIHVIAVVHDSRNPAVWQQRAGDGGG